MLAVVGHGVEVEVEGAPGKSVVAGDRAACQAASSREVMRVIDPRGIFRQVALLGDGIEAGEQGQALVGDQRHDVALALDRPELEGQAARSAWPAGIILRAGQPRGLGQRVEVEPHQIRHEQEQPAAAGRGTVAGASENARTSATASTVGRGRPGRSSSRRRGRGANPSALSTSRTAVGLSAHAGAP